MFCSHIYRSVIDKVFPIVLTVLKRFVSVKNEPSTRRGMQVDRLSGARLRRWRDEIPADKRERSAVRSFILLFFEARVIARDTVRSGEDAFESCLEPLRKIWRRILQHSGVYIGPSLLTVIGRMVRLVDRPFRESGRL